jgi:hypothetical protein
MEQNLLSQLDELTNEVEDLSLVIEKTEKFRAFNSWLQQKHRINDVLCEVNRYEELVSIDTDGTITKAKSLLQIKYNEQYRAKRRADKVAKKG